jgi:double-strand break repair protein MRE11
MGDNVWKGAVNDNVIRIVISTDNHLGFKDKDSVRCDDSYAAFEEVLLTARKRQADFVLLAGDMYHENKPQRRTMHSSMELLRKYTYGQEDVHLEVLNAPDEKVVETPSGRPNFQDPHHAISLPVFSIHGNHDEPTRDGGTKSLSALDLLAEANLINYFGKSDQVDKIEINPVLLRKGDTRVALYGLGAISDERLNRMFEQKKVVFKRPRDKGYFQIFIVHQSADKGRGRKSCLHESMIPEWMDVVIWGNEHECKNELQQGFGGEGTFRIIQPGSSVATSYNETESVEFPKYMAFFMVRNAPSGPQFQMKNKPNQGGEELRYTQYRPFLLKDIRLGDVEGLDPTAHDIEQKISKLLQKHCNAAIKEAREHAELCKRGPKELTYHVRDPHKVLVKLRVEHTGFPTLNPQRFAVNFLDQVANPEALLYFYRKRAVSGTDRGAARKVVNGSRRKNVADREMDSAPSIEDLIDQSLTRSDRPMQVLTGENMAEALKQFVDHKCVSSITDTVEASLEKNKQTLYDAPVAEREQILESIRLLNPSGNGGVVGAGDNGAVQPSGGGDDDDDDDDDDGGGLDDAAPSAGKGKGKRGAAAKNVPAKRAPVARKKKKANFDSSDEDELSDEEIFGDEHDDDDYGGRGESDSDDRNSAPKKKTKKPVSRVKAKVPVSTSRRAASRAPALDLTGDRGEPPMSPTPAGGRKRTLPLFGRRK